MKSPSRLGWPRFTIAEWMAAIVAIAIALIWPVAILPSGSIILTYAMHKAGFTLLEILLISGVVGVALGLALPPIVQK